MATTKLTDVIVPEIFNPYFRELSTKTNAFFASGVVGTVPDLTFGDRGGTQIDMPFWKALTGDAQLLDDDDDLTIGKIESGRDVAVQHARALVYGGTDLAAALAGDDPMEAIAAAIAQNWSEVFNKQLINTLKGALGSFADNTLDISALSGALAYFDGSTFVDATQKLGDAKAKIVAVAMHSAVEAWLRKNDLIDFIPDSEGKETLPFFQGKRVIVDDLLTSESGGVYTSFLFGPDAVGFGEGSPKVPSETDRLPLTGGGQEYLVTRRHYVLHPRGIKWDPAGGVPAKTTPSDAELSDINNWTNVYDQKNIRIVRFDHKIG